MRVKLKFTTFLSDHYCVSTRAATAVELSVLQDIIVTTDFYSVIVKKLKKRRRYE